MKTVIGLMSGTSMDGIDAALIRTDGADRVEPGPWNTTGYDDGFRTRLRAVIDGTGNLAEVERELTLRHAEAVRSLMSEAGMAADEVDLIGFHGQTILHRPEQRLTRQLGDGPLLARETGIPVVFDFRSADVSAGGEGAPLAPVYHRALTAEMARPIAVLNIGGVANVTWIGANDDALIAFDTGPGNALIDDWVRVHTGQRYDENGSLARAGKVDPTRLEQLMAHPYFTRPAPKSLDREAFAERAAAALKGMTVEDGAALLAEFTVSSIAKARDQMPVPPKRWILCGGGRHNTLLVERLRDELATDVTDCDDLGWNGDALEAQAFAYMAVRSQLGLPISFPGTTGVGAPMTGGRPINAHG